LIKKGNNHTLNLFLVDGKTRLKKKLYNCEPHFFNAEHETILKLHPDYHLIISDFLNVKAKVKQVNYGEMDFNQAKDLLFKIETSPVSFFAAASKFVDNSSNGRLYGTVLNSFNDVMPGVGIDEITPKMAKYYLMAISNKLSNNAAHTYMRTLNALFNKVSDRANPFKGVRPKKVKTPAKDLTDLDVKKIIYTRTILNKYDARNTTETINYYRYYWLLCFYLGGIDMIDLAALRYDHHVINGRVQFYRNKGGTNVFVNNVIVDQAKEILKVFDCKPYLVPIYKYKRHNDFVSNMNDRFTEQTKDLKLTKRPLTKSARYTFINRAQQLLIDERITMEIVGHAQQSTHSIYTNEFPLETRDAAHKLIIDL
jgi:integrase